jgi:NTP pyrophosphatase (non-canonical NTP hydrolase)
MSTKCKICIVTAWIGSLWDKFWGLTTVDEKAIEVAKEIKSRAKTVKKELGDVGAAIKEVGNQLGDVGSAAAGKKRRGRPKKKKNGKTKK